jgi:hypothetical protein
MKTRATERLQRRSSLRGAMSKPEEPSPPLTPEREAARQRLNDGERNMLEEMERELGHLLTDQEEHLALEHTRAQQAATP